MPKQSVKKKRISHSKKSEVVVRRLCVIEYKAEGSYYKVGKNIGIFRNQVRYWNKKYEDPHFHNKSLGGDKRSIFKEHEMPILNREILNYLRIHPKAREHELRNHLEKAIQKKSYLFHASPSFEEVALELKSSNEISNIQIHSQKRELLLGVSCCDSTFP